MMRWLTPKQVAVAVQIPISTVLYLCRLGRIRGAIKIDRRWRIHRMGIDVADKWDEDSFRIDAKTALWKAHFAKDHPRKTIEPCVYFIRAGESGPIKIGSTVNMAKRLEMLQVGHHRSLKCILKLAGGEDLERKLHGRFRHLHIRGEWFRAGPDLREFIRGPRSDEATGK